MKWIDEFKAFIQRGNVLDLAVAVIIGAAFKSIVDSLVGDVFGPILGFARSVDGFSGLDVPIYGGAAIKFGAFLQAIINFMLIAFCVFLIIKGVNALHFQKFLTGETKPAELTTQEKLLVEIRDLLKGQAPPPMPEEKPGASL